jgi:hypothetical protein
MSTTHYRNMVEEVSFDEKYFGSVSNCQTKEMPNKVVSFCRKNCSCLTNEEIAFLTKFDAREANFYGLPKAHNSKKIKQAILDQNAEVIIRPFPSDLKIRPIIGGLASPTSRLSKFVDKLLKPFNSSLPSYVRDSSDL